MIGAERSHSETLRELMDFPHHRDELLEGSAISEDVIVGRGYRTIKSKAELGRLGFARSQQVGNALLIPRFSPAGESIPPQMKPDNPRVAPESGRTRKYETPANSGIRLSVHPSMVSRMRDPEHSLMVTEGDKKIDSLASRNQAAVSVQGVNCWNVPQDWEDIKLAGRRVVAAFDGDVSTNPNVQAPLIEMVEFLKSRGAKVQILYLPDGMGIDDYFASGGDLMSVRQYLEDDLREDLAEVGKSLAEIEPEEVSWLWPRRIPRGKITVLDGDPDNGKSVATTDLVARISAGRNMPDGTPVEAAGGVIVSAEDGAGDTIRPRFDAAGGDPSRVRLLGDDEEFVIPRDIPRLERAINQVQAAIVVIDPIMAFFSSEINSNNDQEVRRALTPLKQLAERTGAAIVIVRHLNKASGSNPLYRGGGSIGIVGAARSGLVVGKHPENDELRVLAGQKNNLSLPPESLSYSIETAENGAARIVYQGVAEMNAAELLKTPLDEEERTALDDAKDFIREALDGRDMAAGQMFKDARAAGVSDKTLKRAKSQLRVKSRKDGSEWVWLALEGQGDTSQPRSGPDDPLGPLGNHPKVGPLGPLENSSSSSSLKKAYISEEGQEGQEGQRPNATPLAYELEEGQSSYLRDLKEQRSREEGQAEKCKHDFPGGKGCACCDPESKYHRGRST